MNTEIPHPRGLCIRRPVSVLVASASLTLGFASCEGGSTGPKVEPVAVVAVTPSSGTIEVGQTLQLTATTKDAKGNVLSGRAITWSSGNTSVATVDGS